MHVLGHVYPIREIEGMETWQCAHHASPSMPKVSQEEDDMAHWHYNFSKVSGVQGKRRTRSPNGRTREAGSLLQVGYEGPLIVCMQFLTMLGLEAIEEAIATAKNRSPPLSSPWARAVCCSTALTHSVPQPVSSCRFLSCSGLQW